MSAKKFEIKDISLLSKEKDKKLKVCPKTSTGLSPKSSGQTGSLSVSNVTGSSLNSSAFWRDTNAAHQVEGATVVMKAPLYAAEQTSDKMPYVMCLFGPEEGKYWPLDKHMLTVGRSRRCDITVQDPALSKQHLCIYKNQEESPHIWIEDQRSTNGTVLNESVLKPNIKVQLKDNDKIMLGETTLKFLDKDNPEIIHIQNHFEKAFYDSLTGVGNRLALEREAVRLFKESLQYRTPLSLIVFDVDHFKKVNDTYGHLAGDFVLKELALVVKGCFRSQDLFTRSGGEEFCIIIKSRVGRAKNAIEQARIKVESYVFKYKDQVIPITISAGVTSRIRPDQNWKALYERADQRLYKAKAAGRNKVIVDEG